MSVGALLNNGGVGFRRGNDGEGGDEDYQGERDKQDKILHYDTTTSIKSSLSPPDDDEGVQPTNDNPDHLHSDSIRGERKRRRTSFYTGREEEAGTRVPEKWDVSRKSMFHFIAFRIGKMNS
jgi:hypothetical protein